MEKFKKTPCLEKARQLAEGLGYPIKLQYQWIGALTSKEIFEGIKRGEILVIEVEEQGEYNSPYYPTYIRHYCFGRM